MSPSLPVVHVVDDFYPDPSIARRRALGLSWERPEPSFARRTARHHPPRIRGQIERAFGLSISRWKPGREAETIFDLVNGLFLRHGARETPYVHHDMPPSWWSLVIYLTPGGPLDGGTSFFRHRATGLVAGPTARDAQRLGVPLAELRERLRRDRSEPGRWVEVDRVGFRFNRAILFRSGLLHSATRYFGTRLANERIYHAFHFPARRAPH